MYSYIKGTLEEIGEDYLVVEAGGVGYKIFTAGQTFASLPARGTDVKVYTYLLVREDAMILYGFLEKDDLAVFQMLLGVSGIGPKGALAILSVMTTDDLRFAVLGDDAKAIAKAPGVGAKTAQRLILELKDKLSLEDAFEQKLAKNNALSASAASAEDGAKDDAVLALTALGYSPSEALKALNGIEVTDGMTTEEILRAALKRI